MEEAIVKVGKCIFLQNNAGQNGPLFVSPRTMNFCYVWWGEIKIKVYNIKPGKVNNGIINGKRIFYLQKQSLQNKSSSMSQFLGTHRGQTYFSQRSHTRQILWSLPIIRLHQRLQNLQTVSSSSSLSTGSGMISREFEGGDWSDFVAHGCCWSSIRLACFCTFRFVLFLFFFAGFSCLAAELLFAVAVTFLSLDTFLDFRSSSSCRKRSMTSAFVDTSPSLACTRVRFQFSIACLEALDIAGAMALTIASRRSLFWPSGSFESDSESVRCSTVTHLPGLTGWPILPRQIVIVGKIRTCGKVQNPSTSPSRSKKYNGEAMSSWLI